MDLLLKKILERKSDFKLLDLYSWAKHIDYMIRLDERKTAEIKKVIEWCQQDPFWQNNILSPRKLREQYDQLVLKMNQKKKGIEQDRPNYEVMV